MQAAREAAGSWEGGCALRGLTRTFTLWAWTWLPTVTGPARGWVRFTP